MYFISLDILFLSLLPFLIQNTQYGCLTFVVHIISFFFVYSLWLSSSLQILFFLLFTHFDYFLKSFFFHLLTLNLFSNPFLSFFLLPTLNLLFFSNLFLSFFCSLIFCLLFNSLFFLPSFTPSLFLSFCLSFPSLFGGLFSFFHFSLFTLSLCWTVLSFFHFSSHFPLSLVACFLSFYFLSYFGSLLITLYICMSVYSNEAHLQHLPIGIKCIDFLLCIIWQEIQTHSLHAKRILTNAHFYELVAFSHETNNDHFPLFFFPLLYKPVWNGYSYFYLATSRIISQFNLIFFSSCAYHKFDRSPWQIHAKWQ